MENGLPHTRWKFKRRCRATHTRAVRLGVGGCRNLGTSLGSASTDPDLVVRSRRAFPQLRYMHSELGYMVLQTGQSGIRSVIASVEVYENIEVVAALKERGF